jgi:hypothetical protein
MLEYLASVVPEAAGTDDQPDSHDVVEIWFTEDKISSNERNPSEKFDEGGGGSRLTETSPW